MFEGLISNNKEKINIAPSPQGTPLTNNNENKKSSPPLLRARAKIIFLNLFDCNENSYIYV